METSYSPQPPHSSNICTTHSLLAISSDSYCISKLLTTESGSALFLRVTGKMRSRGLETWLFAWARGIISRLSTTRLCHRFSSELRGLMSTYGLHSRPTYSEDHRNCHCALQLFLTKEANSRAHIWMCKKFDPFPETYSSWKSLGCGNTKPESWCVNSPIVSPLSGIAMYMSKQLELCVCVRTMIVWSQRIARGVWPHNRRRRRERITSFSSDQYYSMFVGVLWIHSVC